MTGMTMVNQRHLDLGPRPTALAPSFTLASRTAYQASDVGNDAVVLVTLGQSNNNNSIPGTYAATHAADIYCSSIHHRGQIFDGGKPLLAGDLTNEHHKRALADQLIADGVAARVVIVMAAMGGSLSSQWAVGGDLNHRIELAARCIAAAGLDHLPVVTDWIQGEADTDASVSEAAYQANLASVIRTARIHGLIDPGRGRKFIVHRCTRLTGASGVRTGIRAAQVAVCDGVSVIQGADIDAVTAGRYDGTHFDIATGLPALVAAIKPYFVTALA